MRTPRRPRGSPRRAAYIRNAALALVALLGTTIVVADPVRGAGESAVRAAAAAWDDVFGNRPKPASPQRMIVVLEAPSLAERMSDNPDATPDDQKRWVAEADASQRLLIARLASRGVKIDRGLSFTRTLNGFSALVDPRAHAELERTPGVAGVYPVRTVYPASVTSRTLARHEFRLGGGRRPDVSLPGFDGSGVTIALLDSGVDHDHPYLGGRVLAGIDLVDRDRLAAAEPKPDEPKRLENHGTQMAGVLVGAGGPAGLAGVAPGARVFPIRVLGWERAAEGSYVLLGRGDVLIGGIERAVDPDADGDIEDAASIALAAVVEPYASFADSPESRSVTGAAVLGTLVTAPTGNDGRAGRGFGTVGAPGGAPAALTVGALDSRSHLLAAPTTLRIGGDVTLDETTRVLGSVAPTAAYAVAGLLGPSLADPRRADTAAVAGSMLADFFDAEGVSRVAGRAALIPGEDGGLEFKAKNAMTAGTSALLVYGTNVAAGALDLEDATAIPVVALPNDEGRAALEALARGEDVSVSFGRVKLIRNGAAGRVAPFSSGGVAFDGRVKPDVVAAGVGVATADAGANADGTPRFATATGSSVAAAVAAGSAALVAQARPGLTAAELRSLLVGSARQLTAGGGADPATLQGAGAIDPAGAAAAEIAVAPVGLAFGRADGAGWRVAQRVTVRNLSTRHLEIDLGITRDDWGGANLSFAAGPAHLSLRPGSSAAVTLVASGSGAVSGRAAGAFLVAPDGSRPSRVPWAVMFRADRTEQLLSAVKLSESRFDPSDSAPSVLAFRAGAIVSGLEGHAVEPVELLVAELWTRDGKRLGVLARLRNLLPGRYAFGLTGRGPHGKELKPGAYMLRLEARPVAGDYGARASTVDVPFTITR
jgi:subtilisin family serine protease